MKRSLLLFAGRLGAWLCFCSLLFPQALSSQEPSPVFSSIDNDLQQLESLIADTLNNTLSQQRQLEDLKRNLNESGALIKTYETIIAERESLLKDLQTQLHGMSETYKAQSNLSAKYEENSRFWRTFTLIAVPAAALLSGGLVYAVTR